MNLKQGDRLKEYEIISLLGVGGMGEVWLARDILLQRDVAIKCLNPLLTQDNEFKNRFLREARIQGQLTHNNIVGLYSFFESESQFFMVMEYSRGITLRQLIDRIGPIPEKRAIPIFEHILKALRYAHSKGIIHRDIKPSNIMIDESQSDAVKVMDFGIARMMDDMHLTHTGTRMGTMSYMSPEQVQADKDIDQRSDLYSSGVVLYEMLSGKLPFDTDTSSEYAILHCIVTEQIPDPREIYPYIREGSVALINQLTQKDKENRPQSINDLLINAANKGLFTVGGKLDTHAEEPSSPLHLSKPDYDSNPPQRKINALGLILVIIALGVITYGILKIFSQGAQGKNLVVTNVLVNGNAAEYIKVTDGTYTLEQEDNGLEMTIGAELPKEITGDNPDSLMLGNWTLTFKNADGVTVMGMESVPLMEAHKEVLLALMKSPVGEKKEITFSTGAIENKDYIKRILKEVASFELNTELMGLEFPAIVEEVIEETTVATTPKPKPPTTPAVTPPKPPVQSQNWDGKLAEYETAVDRYVAMKSKNPTDPREIRRLQEQRTKVETLSTELGAAPDMTAAQKTRYNKIKTKMN